MKFSVAALVLTGGVSALPTLSSITSRQSADLASRSSELTDVEVRAEAGDLGIPLIETEEDIEEEEEEEEEEEDNEQDFEPKVRRRSNRRNSTKIVVTRAATGGGAALGGGNGAPRVQVIGDNKVNPTTGLTDTEAAEIVTGLNLNDKKAPGSINAKGQRNPLPGLSAAMTDAIVKQGQAALKAGSK